MTTAERETLPTIGFLTREEPSFFVINLYTWLTDQRAAADLALRVVEVVRSISDIDALATTVANEDDLQAEPARVFLDFPRVDGDQSGP
ncbi:hypothetical protein [Virgisporangium aurantiacum]|uniref:Uncharacterized protein n=1 Tax=Virgisporangium aurantiacum TaxID=175570 RepID=A0A8J4DZM9_9ACTN|nr:hypothetical protein [Virgisporangium aurantiacum]GIJ56079.1 hypothetical protein Vau01_035950 [Virgisporangium aurantiacum]